MSARQRVGELLPEGSRSAEAAKSMRPAPEPKPEPSDQTFKSNPYGPIANGERMHGPSTQTWLDPSGEKLRVARTRERVSELVVHETVTTSYDATMRALRSKRLGVQFIVAPDGRISQHGDAVTDMQEHVGAHNGPSVGVEVVTPYYPTSLPKGGPWAHVIEAPWAHRGRYVLPTPESCEALVQLVAWITTGNVRGLEVPRAWVGYDDKSHTFRLTQLRDPSPRPGVWSHQQIGGHADGSWLALYALLRIRWRLAPADARDAAATVATGCRGLVYLDRVVPVAPAAP